MPVSVRQTKPAISLRIPQARVLAALMPTNLNDPVMDWPLLARPMLGVRAGYTAISGTVTRALNGIPQGSSSGDPHLGLLGLGLVEEVILTIERVKETNYRATAAGIATYQQYTTKHGELPQLRDAAVCTNDRYKKGEADASI